MNEKKRDSEITEILLGVAELFGGKLSKPGLMLWLSALDGFSVDEVRKAAGVIVKTRVFTSMPTPAEFINAVHGNPEDKAQVEAGKVLDAIAAVGSYNSVLFDDPTTIAVIKQGFGGWIKMCRDLADKDTMWFRKDFAKIYSSYAREGIKSSGVLVGIVEGENRAAGYLEHIPDPVVIGDPKKAMALITAEKKQPKNLISLTRKIG